MQTDVVIIGGGIAGLTCAVELCASGLAVVVLESSAALGGRARSCTDDETGDRIDIGPHILLSEYRNMLRLLDDLGTRDRIVWQADKFITLVGKPYPVDIRMHRLPAPLHFLPSLLGVPQASLRDLASNRRLLWQVMRMSARDAQHLDSVSALDYLRESKVSKHFIDWFWRSAAMSIMNVPLERCSAGALLRFFRFMIGRNGYQVGFAGIGLGDLFVPQAVARIERAGSKVLTDSNVVEIAGSERTVSGVRLADGSHIEARRCIASTPPRELAALLPPSWAQRHEAFHVLPRFAPSPYVSSYLWFDRKLTRERFWARVWSPDNLNYDFYDLANIRPDWADRPSIIASNILYSHRASALSDQDIIDTSLRELADFAPEAKRARLRHARVHRIPMGIPAPYPGSEQLRPETTTPIEGLFLAGDWVRTGLPASMESAVRAGYLAVEAILASTGRKPRRLAQPLPAAEGLVRLVGGK